MPGSLTAKDLGVISLKNRGMKLVHIRIFLLINYILSNKSKIKTLNMLIFNTVFLLILSAFDLPLSNATNYYNSRYSRESEFCTVSVPNRRVFYFMYHDKFLEKHLAYRDP